MMWLLMINCGELPPLQFPGFHIVMQARAVAEISIFEARVYAFPGASAKAFAWCSNTPFRNTHV